MLDGDPGQFAVFIGSLFSVLAWPAFGYLLIGLAIGFVVGILPGLGGGVAMALMLPFTFAMDPIAAFAFLLAMKSVLGTTGDLTSILFGVPGEGDTAATVVDGHQMARRGLAARAMGIALTGSCIGALIGAFFLAGIIPFIRPLVLSFGPPEFFMLGVLALTAVASVSGRSQVRGLIMAGLGLVMSCVGQEAGTGRLRLTFGELYLFDGISIVPVVIGLFAVPAIVALMVKDEALSADFVKGEAGSAISGAIGGTIMAIKHWWLILRCAAIGIFFGLLPGLGSGAAQWVAYAHARQTSKTPDDFGKGADEGVLAPGTVNNSTDAASLVTTVGFGVPGSGSMAILLAAFLIVGLTPGPAMLTHHLDVTFSMVWTMVIANLVSVAICFLFLNQIAKITFLRASLLVPFLLLFIIIGAYTSHNSSADIVLMLTMGVLGVIAFRFGWPVPPLLLGLILGDIVERNFYTSYSLYDRSFGWLSRPIVLVILCLITVMIALPIGKSALRSLRGRKADTLLAERIVPLGADRSQNILRVNSHRALFGLATFAIGIIVLYQMQWAGHGYNFRARAFPTALAFFLMTLSFYQILIDLFNFRGSHEDAGEADPPPALEVLKKTLLQGGSFLAVVWLLGFLAGIPLYCFAYLLLIARERWWVAALGGLASWAFIYFIFVVVLPTPLMEGLVFSLL